MNDQNKKDQSFMFEDQSSLTDTTQCGKMTKMRQSRRSSDVAVVTQKKNEIDQHPATTLKGLSAQERNAAFEEVNGIVDCDLENSNEDPAVLDRKLIEMDQYLQTIKGGSVYETAESMDLDYVQNQEFRLKFLRCQRYDPTKAAKQVIDFFESKQWLFGEEKLCKDITLDDLSKKERRFFRERLLASLSSAQRQHQPQGGAMEYRPAVTVHIIPNDNDEDTDTQLKKPPVNQEATKNFSVGKPASIAITPRRTDVLFGTRRMHHPGNLQLWQVVSQQLENFESMVHRAEKSKFVGMLLQHMKASGVRFLAMDKASNRWIEVDDRIARNKLTKAFHNKR